MVKWLKGFAPQHFMVCLGCFGLGNVWRLAGVSQLSRLALLLYVATLIIVVVRNVVHPDVFKQELGNVMQMAGYVACLFCAYFAAQLVGGGVGKWIWWVTLGINLLLFVYFLQMVLKGGLDWDKVLPIWYFYFLFCGLAAIPGPSLGVGVVAKTLAYLALVFYIGLTPFIWWRVLHKPMPPMLQSSLMIVLAAPAMTLTALFQAVPTLPFFIALVLIVINQGLWIYFGLQAKSFLALPFGPPTSAFTFPFAISVIALYGFTMHYTTGIIHKLLLVLCYGEGLFATGAILLVLGLFLRSDWQRLKQ